MVLPWFTNPDPESDEDESSCRFRKLGLVPFPKGSGTAIALSITILILEDGSDVWRVAPWTASVVVTCNTELPVIDVLPGLEEALDPG